jgi:hypothetical protein
MFFLFFLFLSFIFRLSFSLEGFGYVPPLFVLFISINRCYGGVAVGDPSAPLLLLKKKNIQKISYIVKFAFKPYARIVAQGVLAFQLDV